MECSVEDTMCVYNRTEKTCPENTQRAQTVHRTDSTESTNNTESTESTDVLQSKYPDSTAHSYPWPILLSSCSPCVLFSIEDIRYTGLYVYGLQASDANLALRRVSFRKNPTGEYGLHKAEA